LNVVCQRRRGEGRREHVCLKALVAETNGLLAASLSYHVGIRVKETSEAAVVSAEPAQLQQVILNLCNNAAQAMDEAGDIEIRIEVRKLTEPLRVGRIDIGPGSFAIVSISDPGARHGRSNAGADFRAVLYHASRRQRPRARDRSGNR
jgi:signal transduction histidine kinase